MPYKKLIKKYVCQKSRSSCSPVIPQQDDPQRNAEHNELVSLLEKSKVGRLLLEDFDACATAYGRLVYTRIAAKLNMPVFAVVRVVESIMNDLEKKGY